MNRKEFFGTLGASAVAAGALKAAVPASTATPVSAAIPNLARLLCLDDVEAAAKPIMSESVYNFVAGGAADELTIRWNREKYRDIRLAEEVLQDVSNLDCSTTVLGQQLSMPILVAPSANHKLVHPE